MEKIMFYEKWCNRLFKRVLVAMISLSILITSTFTIQGDEKAEMKCKSYVLMEASSKTVIKAENENEIKSC